MACFPVKKVKSADLRKYEYIADCNYPPIWLAWYAKLFYLLMAVGCVCFIIKVYRHRLLLKGPLEMERRRNGGAQQLCDEHRHFFSKIKYELRTPLTHILGQLDELAADKQLPENYKKRVEMIHTSYVGLFNRIDEILESRKTEARNGRLVDAKGQRETVEAAVSARPCERASGLAEANGAGQTLKRSKVDDEFIQKITRIVEDNLTSQELDMTFMQEALNMSHSTLYRKIKGLTGMSGNEFIRKVRLERGCELLKDGCNVSEAAYSAGFNDVGYFRICFKNEYGMSPSKFIKQLRK